MDGIWLQSGKKLNTPDTMEKAIVEAGLNWQIIEADTYWRCGDSLVPSKQYKALVRESDNYLLAYVSPSYKIMQNTQVFEWFNPLIADGSVRIDAAGSFNNGRHIWVVAEINTPPISVSQDDTIKPYILLYNSNDGTSSAKLKFIPVRVVCSNMINSLLRVKGDTFSIRHNSKLTTRLETARNVINLAQRSFSQSLPYYQEMAKHSISTSEFYDFFLHVFELKNVEKSKIFPIVQQNFTSGRGNVGKSWWDAYNALTEWIDHDRGQLVKARLYSSFFGDSLKKRDRAFEYIKNAILA